VKKEYWDTDQSELHKESLKFVVYGL